jgi:hypothetical protein
MCKPDDRGLLLLLFRVPSSCLSISMIVDIAEANAASPLLLLLLLPPPPPPTPRLRRFSTCI